MTYTVIKRGSDDWSELIGNEISFEWTDGWDTYLVDVEFAGVEKFEGDDPRYPLYYITDVDGEGYAIRGNEEVTVTVHD